MSDIRQRKTASTATPPVSTTASAPSSRRSGAGTIVKAILALALAALAFLAYAHTGGERTFTLKQLSAYDGSNEALPVYISINGTVYDVSANRRVYGKGGAYNMMAGRDASRSFITGCFETHLTHDLRGMSDKELESLKTWTDFFENSPKYHRVGVTKLPPIAADVPIPPPCANPKTH